MRTMSLTNTTYPNAKWQTATSLASSCFPSPRRASSKCSSTRSTRARGTCSRSASCKTSSLACNRSPRAPSSLCAHLQARCFYRRQESTLALAGETGRTTRSKSGSRGDPPSGPLLAHSAGRCRLGSPAGWPSWQVQARPRLLGGPVRSSRAQTRTSARATFSI